MLGLTELCNIFIIIIFSFSYIICTLFLVRFTNEWMKGNIPDEYFDSIENALPGHVASMPHEHSRPPDYTNIQSDQIKTSTVISLGKTEVHTVNKFTFMLFDMSF